MLPKYEDFYLIVNGEAGRYTVEAQGPGHSSVSPVPFVYRETEELHVELEDIQEGHSPSRSAMQEIGTFLFEALMPRPILLAFGKAASALPKETQLRLRLNIRPPELARLPWELLFNPNHQIFLATRRTQPIVRFLDSNSKPVAPLQIEGPLKVLYVTAQPRYFEPLNVEKSQQTLQNTLGHRAEITVLEKATPAKLRNILRRHPFHLLHYDGHGIFDEDDQRGLLLLESDQEDEQALSGEELVTYLDGTQVRLVVLAACETGMDSTHQRFVGVAQELMRKSNLPAVVAMQFAISDDSAIAFIEGFYGALADGYPIEASVAEGRMAILEQTGLQAADWATPILLMRTTDGRLWQRFIEGKEAKALLTSRAPYMGLRTFREEDADFFFGREGLVKLLVQKVEKSPFLAVLGPSGSGKSSVVLAGLLPALQHDALPNSSSWHYLTIKPTNRPLDTLAAALNKLQGGNLGQLSELRQVLLSDQRALLLATDMVRADNPETRLVLVVDQFEELWTLAPTEAEARQAFVVDVQKPFIRLLLSAISEQADNATPSLIIILTMRADFLHRAAEKRDLALAIGEHDVIVSPMEADELRRAILEPAQLAGGTFEPGLVDELIKQTLLSEGALPLLSYTLLDLWKTKRQDGTMRWKSYYDLGGLEGALAARADQILSIHYTYEQQEELRHLLLRLVQPGEGTIDTRRRALLGDLVPAGMDANTVQLLLKPLVDERLLTTGHDQATDSETIEVSHEALIRAWPTFEQWIDEAREDLRLQLQLEEAAKEWEANDEELDYLWSGLRLANAEAWLKRAQPLLNERDQRFLSASRAEEEARREAEESARRERERLMAERAREEGRATLFRNFLGVATLLLLVALVFAGLAWSGQQEAEEAEATAQAERIAAQEARSVAQQQRDAAQEANNIAQQERDAAQEARTKAESLADAGESLFELTRKPEQALLLALAASRYETSADQAMVSRALYRAFDDALIRESLPVGGALLSVEWSPDGKRALTSNNNGRAQIWELATGKVILPLEDEECSIGPAAWSPDGQQLVTGGHKGKVCIWDAQTGTALQKLAKNDQSINSVAWHPDKSQVLTGGNDGTVRIWDIASQTERALNLDNGPILSVAWYPNGQLVVVGHENGTVHFWDVESGTDTGSLKAHDGQVFSLAFRPTGALLLTGGADDTARVWDVATWTELLTLSGHIADVRTVSWSANGEQILTGSDDKTVRIWDATTGTELRRLEGHTDPIRAVAFSRDARQVLTGSDDQTVRVWDVVEGTELRLLAGHQNFIYAVAWSPDEQKVLTGSNDGKTLIWDLTTNTKQELDSGAVFAAAWHPKGAQVVTGGVDGNRNGKVTVTNTETGIIEQSWTNDGLPVYAVAWSPEGRQIAAGGEGNTVHIWQMGEEEPLHTLASKSSLIFSLAWSPDADQLLVGRNDGRIEIWNVATESLEDTLAGHLGIVYTAAWNPAHKEQVATGAQDGSVRIWNVVTREELKRLEGHQDIVYSVKWSPDGRLLLTGSADETARLWDVETAKEIHLMESHQAPIWSVAWSPTGMLALTGGEDSKARIWMVNRQLITADLVRRVCHLFTNEQITSQLADWRGCETEKAQDYHSPLATYDALRQLDRTTDTPSESSEPPLLLEATPTITITVPASAGAPPAEPTTSAPLRPTPTSASAPPRITPTSSPTLIATGTSIVTPISSPTEIATERATGTSVVTPTPTEMGAGAAGPPPTGKQPAPPTPTPTQTPVNFNSELPPTTTFVPIIEPPSPPPLPTLTPTQSPTEEENDGRGLPTSPTPSQPSPSQTPTPTITSPPSLPEIPPSPSEELLPTLTATSEPSPIASPTVTPTPEASQEPEIIPTPSPTVTPTPEALQEPEIILTPAPAVTPTPEALQEPEIIPTPAPTVTPTPEASQEPEIIPTPASTMTPTPEASQEPEIIPTPASTMTPTPERSQEPEIIPTPAPTMTPTPEASQEPEIIPTPAPTVTLER